MYAFTFVRLDGKLLAPPGVLTNKQIHNPFTMKAPMSDEIAALLQDPRSARKLMDAVLASRTAPGNQFVEVFLDGKIKRYKPVTAIHRRTQA